MLRLRDVSVFYGDMQALHDVSLEIQQGEIVALVGANGAGKTTTLKTISGLLRPAAGSIEFDGTRLDAVPAHDMAKLGIAHVPEGRRLFPLLTVEENLDLGSMTPAARAQRSETKEWVFKLLARLAERRHQLAETLSGGEQQMCAIARGLMARPKLLLLDEPSLGLAPILVNELFATIAAINREGVTILLVEQNVRRSLALAGRAYVLENGRIVLSGPTADLKTNPHVKKAYLGL
ncbi:MAG: ABC transporter ATP-binding protein [candidate division NC10 bacterium]|nr:ABC transporter ATP-binding protein [candidate division NC10 bacterium]MBI2113830.1 ABC transporter ATP-binding protein [candidate division NC10 bacterium]MBI2456571.1 ABC transporter ATP-binding protein [candidate division NC10 bacterium]